MYFNTFRRSVRLARVSFLVLSAAVAAPSQAPAQWAVVRIMVAPPPLPYYEQPAMPGAGYMWTPGYWAWDNGDYYWVPGTWVEPPAVGMLWTPGYWICRNDLYYWNPGYWGEHVGFYGGVNYGYGYTGSGYAGGYWNGTDFNYNSTVNNFGDVSVSNAYEQTVVDDNTTTVSFNGGVGGTTAMPNQDELRATQERHFSATMLQVQHQAAASADTELRASINGGHPQVAGTTNAATLVGPGVTGTHFGHNWPTVQNHHTAGLGITGNHNVGVVGQHPQLSLGGAGGRLPGANGQFQPQQWNGGMAGRLPGVNGQSQPQQQWNGGMAGRLPGANGQFQPQQQWNGGMTGRPGWTGGQFQPQQQWTGGSAGRPGWTGGQFQPQQQWTGGSAGRPGWTGGQFQPQQSWTSGSAGRPAWTGGQSQIQQNGGGAGRWNGGSSWGRPSSGASWSARPSGGSWGGGRQSANFSSGGRRR
jgi:hypothetical protein